MILSIEMLRNPQITHLSVRLPAPYMVTQLFIYFFLKSIFYGVNVAFQTQYIMALITQSLVPLKASLSAMDFKSQF